MQLPEKINPYKLTDRKISLVGELSYQGMERFQEFRSDEYPTIDVQLDFTIDQMSSRIITGQIKAVVKLTCQRCLQAFLLPIQPEVNLELLKNLESEEKLSSGFEPLIVPENQELLLAALIEDELLLALPLSPMHKQNDCNVTFADFFNQNRKDNPFAVLSSLKK